MKVSRPPEKFKSESLRGENGESCVTSDAREGTGEGRSISTHGGDKRLQLSAREGNSS
jgi:hypothetical protein